ncbi:hypothetical protein BJV77DRAFT_965534 [Russula vinacea]|nr:hypothetical protein BJV77DRAFT_965534 [Russula vinacea]
MYARNEDLPESTTQLSISPYVRGPSIPVRDDFRPNSFTDFNAPLSLRNMAFSPHNRFLPAPSFHNRSSWLLSGGDQADTTAGYASVVSIFCHDCGLFFRGVREEGLEVLNRHQCMGPINGGYTYDFDFLPDGRRWPLYREEYFEPNLTNANPV